MKIDLYLIRHGKTEYNEEKRYAGCKTDCSISEAGRKEVEENKENGRYPTEPYMIFRSPMKRAEETAEIIYPGEEKTVIEDIREIDFGTFEGKNYDELNGGELYQKWIDSGGKMPFPEGESIEDYTKRVLKGIEAVKKAVAEKAAKDGLSDSEEPVPVAVVCHGGTIMVMKYCIYGGDYFNYLAENGECVKISL